MDGFNTNVMKPVFKKIVFIGETITHIKTKIIQCYQMGIIRKTYSTFVGYSVVFAIMMKMIIIPNLIEFYLY